MIYVFSHNIKHIFVISSRTLLTSKKWNAPSAHIHVLLCINATKLLYYLKKCDSHTRSQCKRRIRNEKSIGTEKSKQEGGKLNSCSQVCSSTISENMVHLIRWICFFQSIFRASSNVNFTLWRAKREWKTTIKLSTISFNADKVIPRMHVLSKQVYEQRL